MKSVGDILRTERLRQNLTLEEVSNKIKIRLDYLKSLEQGKYDQLPDPIYVRGFISSYARALEIDDEQILPFYRREYGGGTNKLNMEKIPKPIDRPGFRLTPGALLVAAVSVVLTLFLVLLFIQYRNYAGIPVLIVDSPQDNLVSTNPTIEVNGRTDPEAEITVNGQSVKPSVDGSFRITYELDVGINRIKILAKTKLGKENLIEKIVNYTNNN
jgi:cytoskeletal protein RodZ